MKLPWRKVFFEDKWYQFIVSITKWDGWAKQGVHAGLSVLFIAHLSIAQAVVVWVSVGAPYFDFTNPALATIVIALIIEIKDGFKKVNREGRPAEGFNIFPDLLIRCLPSGVVLCVNLFL